VQRRQLKLIGLYTGAGAHPAGWRMPGAVANADIGFEHYARAAQTAERGKLDGIIFDDCAAAPAGEGIESRNPEREGSARAVWLEPVEIVPALAMLTDRIGLIATTSTAYNAPYHIARRYATLDHITNGRAGWRLRVSASPDEALNFAHAARLGDAAVSHARAAEFVRVCAGLWDSWDPDSVLRDKASGRYFDPAKVHVLNHVGQFFSVRGPLNVARCPQGRPVIIQSDDSDAGCELAAQAADVIITRPADLAAARAQAEELRSRCVAHGRTREALKILPQVMPIVGRSDEQARDLCDQLHSLAAARGETPATHVISGSPATLADMFQRWLEAEAADGFVIAFPYYPAPVEDFVTLVVPELQQRGLFRTEYQTKTLRDHLGLATPDSAYAQRSTDDLMVPKAGGGKPIAL
jgi:N-acetyl-S-(2-succino)cysteine monooxygenase